MAWAYGLIQHWRNVICVCYESVPRTQSLMYGNINIITNWYFSESPQQNVCVHIIKVQTL